MVMGRFPIFDQTLGLKSLLVDLKEILKESLNKLGKLKKDDSSKISVKK